MKKKIRVFGILTVLVIVMIHILNRIAYSVSKVRDLLTGKESNYYDWRFGKIKFNKKGTGTPLLLIHHLAPGNSSYEFHKLFQELSKSYEVYSLDLIGYGISDKPNFTYTSFLYVELITDFIKNVIGKKTDVVTSGDASSIAIMASHNNPEIINRMTFINPQDINVLQKIPTRQTKMLKLLIELPIIGTFVYNIITSKSKITKQFKDEYYYNEENIDKKDIYAYVEAAHMTNYQSKYSFASYKGLYTNINILHALTESNYSMNIISGKEKYNAGSIVEAYLKYNAAIEHSYIDETKMLPHLEKPDEVADEIRMYFN